MGNKLTFGKPADAEAAPTTPTVNLTGKVTPITKPATLQERTNEFKFKPITAQTQQPTQTLAQTPCASKSALVVGGTEITKQAAPVALADTHMEIQPQTSQDSAQAGDSNESDTSKYIHPTQPDAATAEATEEFRRRLQLLADSFGEDKEQVGDNVRDCARYLQEHKELKGLLQPEDVQIMVRGMRTTYASVAQAKRGRKAKATKTSKDVDAVMDLLGDFTL